MSTKHINKRALLLGNGINRLEGNQSFSWPDLLARLKSHFSINVDLENAFKPFPLAFEEMLHQKPGRSNFDGKIKNLKQKIRALIETEYSTKTGFNNYHRSIMALRYDDILTTNYDYSLEKCIIKDFDKTKDSHAIDKRETKHSLRRGYRVTNNGPIIWHIHGELSSSREISEKSIHYKEESIMIGYEHYESYLEVIQRNVKGKSGAQKIDFRSLKKRLEGNEHSPFWTDIIFTHDVDIVGLALDFSEDHLWYLINHRANLNRGITEKQETRINNRIRFFYPLINGSEILDIKSHDVLDEIIKKKNQIAQSKAIAEVLAAFQVEATEIRCNSYEDFYNIIIRDHLV